MKRSYEVLANIDAEGATSAETLVVTGTDPDDVCGAAIGRLRGQFGDEVSVRIRRLTRVVEGGNAPVTA